MDACEAVARGIRDAGGEARTLELELRDASAIARAVETVTSESPLTWLVNNAGIVKTASVGGPSADEEHLTLHMDVNFHGPRRLTEAFLPSLIEADGGHVVQVASSAALQGYPFVAAYTASKHALLGWSRAAAHDLARRGVSVNTVCPHFVDSPMTAAGAAATAARTGKSADEIKASYAGFNPTGVLVTPEEVADAILEQLEAKRTGAVLELLGGGERRVVEEGRALPS
jgi:3-hydroxybutyrate dehydrogenase